MPCIVCILNTRDILAPVHCHRQRWHNIRIYQMQTFVFPVHYADMKKVSKKQASISGVEHV